MATTVPVQSDKKAADLEKTLRFPDNRLLIDLCGEFDKNLTHIESALGVQIVRRGNEIAVLGDADSSERALEALQALITESQKNVSGTVRLKLYKGNIITAGRKSPLSLYNTEIATMEADPTQAYNQDDATGFIRLNGLRLKVGAQVHQHPAPKKARKKKAKSTRKKK